jgi:hypothetical protein
MDVVLDVDEIVTSCYGLYSFQQEIVDDIVLTRIVRMRTFCDLRVECERCVLCSLEHSPHGGRGMLARHSNPGHAAFDGKGLRGHFELRRET